MFYYRIFGLVVATEIKLEETSTLAGSLPSHDVEVKLGDMSLDIRSYPDTVFFTDDWFYCAPRAGQVLVAVQNFAFEITDAKNITVSLPKGEYRKDLLRTLLLGLAFGVLFMQRGAVPVHGAAVEKDGIATIITGYSGTGKSAILAALIENGVRYLADDVCIVSWDSNKAIVMPAYPQRKLSIDSAQELGINTEGISISFEDNRDKYLIRDASEWCSEAKPLGAVIEIIPCERKDGKAFGIESQFVTGREALFLMMRNLYKVRFYESIGFSPMQMKQLLQTVSNISVMQVRRQLKNYPIREGANEILKLMAQTTENI